MIKDIENFLLECILSNDKYREVNIVAKYEIAREVIGYLAGANKLVNLDIAQPDFNGYDKEYVITVTTEGEIWAEPMWREAYYIDGKLMREAGYIHVGLDEVDGNSIVYIHNDCSSKVIPFVGEAETFEFSIDEEKSIRFIKDEEGNIIGLNKPYEDFCDAMDYLLALLDIKENFDHLALINDYLLEISYKS